MADLLKNMYNPESLRKLADDIKSVYPAFQAEDFLRSVMNDTWETLELKDRITHISKNLGAYLPEDYREAISVIDKVAPLYGSWLEGFSGFFPVFVELFGQDEENWEASMAALARYNDYASSELAVRSFIIKHELRAMEQMYAWSKSENEFTRRLASEGCRPALPWGQALNSFKKDPSPILPILEQLKNDPSIHVRKSVANNLNDISKTHPELVVKIAKDWYGKNEQTDWIVKHACRTLLKKGNRELLALFGYDEADSVTVQDFAVETNPVLIGDDLVFSFSIITTKEIKVRLEYAIDYVKAKAKRSRKIFKISEVSLKENEKKLYTRKHSFEDVSVRKHYPGLHSVTLIVNGAERGTLDFLLEENV